MLHIAGVWVLLAAAVAGKPSLVVLPVTVGGNVSQAFSEAATSVVLDNVRQHQRFGSVFSTKDMETLVGMEQKRQLIDCNSASCLAEIGAALGADFVLHGACSRVGSAYVVSLSMTNARTARSEGAATRTLRSEDEADVLATLPGMVAEMLGEAPRVANAAAHTVSMPSAQDTPPADAASGEGPKPLTLAGRGLLACGAALLATAWVPGVVAFGGGAAAAGSLAARDEDAILGTGLGRLLLPAMVMGLSALGLGMLGASLLMLGGTVSLVMGLVVGVAL